MSIEYLLIVPMLPLTVGDSWPIGTRLPMHLTVMPWFSLREIPFEDFNACLHKLVEKEMFSGMTLVPGANDMHGPENNIPVTLVKSDEVLELLHTTMLIMLAAKQRFPNDLHHVGAGYLPHVTKVIEDVAFDSPFTATHMAVIARDAANSKLKTLVAMHPIGFDS